MTLMSEGQLAIPRIGIVSAAPVASRRTQPVTYRRSLDFRVDIWARSEMQVVKDWTL